MKITLSRRNRFTNFGVPLSKFYKRLITELPFRQNGLGTRMIQDVTAEKGRILYLRYLLGDIVLMAIPWRGWVPRSK